MPDSRIPNHVAVIPDGNRRYAKARSMLPWEGHRAGAETFKKLIDWCKEAGVKELTLWSCSTDNLLREKKEVNFLLKLFEEFADDFMKSLEKGKVKEKVKVRFIGDLDRLPKKLAGKLRKIEKKTKNNDDYKLNFLVAYGGEWELVRASKLIAEEAKSGKLDVKNITSELFEKHLMLQDKPDLVIRTSQERLSGFLPWQSAYSEIIFLKDKHWPEFSKEDFKNCLDEYARRKRTYGR